MTCYAGQGCHGQTWHTQHREFERVPRLQLLKAVGLRAQFYSVLADRAPHVAAGPYGLLIRVPQEPSRARQPGHTIELCLKCHARHCAHVVASVGPGTDGSESTALMAAASATLCARVSGAQRARGGCWRETGLAARVVTDATRGVLIASFTPHAGAQLCKTGVEGTASG